MKTIKRRIISCTLLLLLALALLPALSAPAHAELPPRPEDKPTRVPRSGGGILLTVSGATAPYYALVQWQDGLAGWHDVEGWRGQVEDGHVLWYVSKKHFGDGPFRWVVYRGEETLATSGSFDLPDVTGETVYVSVTVD